MTFLSSRAFGAPSATTASANSTETSVSSTDDGTTTYAITAAQIFPSTADSAEAVGTPAPFPAGSENDPAVLAAWQDQAGDLLPEDVVSDLVGTQFDAVDVASMKARLAAYRSMAVTEDPASALAMLDANGSAYFPTENGGHMTVTPIGYIDGEGNEVLTGTLQTGATFYVYLQLVIAVVTPPAS
jgi:hypothetical protein